MTHHLMSEARWRRKTRRSAWSTVCTHWWQHTMYGSGDRDKNGTFCALCGARLG